MARDRLSTHTAVNDVVVYDRVIVYHRRISIHIHHLRPRHDVMERVRIAEMVYRHECVVIIAKPEVERNGYVAAVVGEADARSPIRFRWERRPTTVTFRIAPAHPGRTPNDSGRPNPAGPRMHIP